MKLAATILVASLIWWGNQGGETATTTDTILFVIAIISALIIGIHRTNKDPEQ